MSFLDRWRSGRSIKLTEGSFWGAWGGGTSHARETVTQETLLQIGAAYACARLVSETIAAFPFGMMEDLGSAGSKPARDHPLHDVLRYRPNGDQTPIEYFETVILQLLLRGNHFSLKLKDGGRTIGLEPLPPWPLTKIQRNDAGAREFVVTSGPRQRDRPYREDEVFFVRGFGEDRDIGYSVISLARHSLGRQLAMEKHAGKFLANGVRPNVVLKTGAVLTEEQRQQVQDNIVKPFVGADGSGGMMVLEGGFDVDQVSLSPADAQLLEQMVFGVEEVCRWFRVPPFLIGHRDNASKFGTGLETETQGFAKFTLLPLVKRVTQAMASQLLDAGDRKTYYPHANMDGLLQGDSKTRGLFLSMMVSGGIYSPNEARAKENLPPKEGGDELRMQQQMTPLGGLDQNLGDDK